VWLVSDEVERLERSLAIERLARIERAVQGRVRIGARIEGILEGRRGCKLAQRRGFGFSALAR
jgi:hypothetical protein